MKLPWLKSQQTWLQQALKVRAALLIDEHSRIPIQIGEGDATPGARRRDVNKTVTLMVEGASGNLISFLGYEHEIADIWQWRGDILISRRLLRFGWILG